MAKNSCSVFLFLCLKFCYFAIPLNAINRVYEKDSIGINLLTVGACFGFV